MEDGEKSNINGSAYMYTTRMCAWLNLYVYKHRMCAHAHHWLIYMHITCLFCGFILLGWVCDWSCHIHDGSLLEKALGPETIEVSGAAHW